MNYRYRTVVSFAYIRILFLLLFVSVSYAADILSPQERAWLNENKSRIVLAVETNYSPFVFIGSNDAPTGLAHEYMLLVESKLGVSFKERRFSSLDEIFSKAKSKDVHIINAVTATPKRSSFLLFTDSFVSIPNVIVVNKNRQGFMQEKDLYGLRLSLIKSYASTEYLTNKGIAVTPDLAPNDLAALLSVSFGSSDATVVDLATASYLISQKGITNLKVAGEIDFNIKLSMASSIDEPILRDILQKAISAITETERKEIYNRWINTTGQSIFNDWRFWAIIGALLLISLVVVVWNRTLQRQINLRVEAEEKLRILNSELTKQVEEGVRKRMQVEIEHQKEREALIQSEKMAQLGSMLGAIIHQWKQPLSAISLEAQDILESYKYNELTQEEIERVVNSIMAKVAFMTVTANDFRDFYKPSKEKKAFSIIEQIGLVAKLLEKQLKLNNIKLHIDGDPSISVVGFTSEFKQVVLNILNNAKDAFEERKIEDATIDVQVSKDKDIAVITISDNAGGIPDELLPDRLFEEFMSTKGEKGTGIGLHLSRIIIERNMKGSLSAKNIDSGACFIIKLPM